MVSRSSQTSHDTNDSGELQEEGLSPAECAVLEGVVWKKFDRRVLPLCTSLFVLALVDQGNIASARVAGMQLSLGLSDYQYTIALTATYVSYLAAMFPSALLLKHVGPHIMLPAMAISWGVASASQGLVNNFPALLACRFFLGIAEGGLFTGIILYLSFFYPRKRLQIRVAALSASASIIGAFSGLLAATINQINRTSGKPGWAWIFILEGIFTFAFGVISLFFLPRSPGKACFLTEKERVYVIAALKRTGSVSKDDRKDNFSWAEVINTAKSPHVWLLTGVSFFNGMMLFGLGFFEPVIVAGLGYNDNRALLMSSPPYAVTFFLSLVSGAISDGYRCRGYTVIFFALLELVGFTMFYASTSNHVRYASLFFSVSGTTCVMPALIAWIANNSAPHTRRATAVAVTAITTEAGGIFSTWLLGYLSPAPSYKMAIIIFIAMSIGTVVLSTANLVYLWQENRSKEKRRQRMEKDDELEGLGDRSAWFMYSL